MENRFKEAAIKARQMTNKQLASEITSLTKLTRDELNELLPAKKDKEAFVELMNAVQDETDMDNKLAYLRENMETAGTIVFKLLKAIV
ncbi:MAG: hypothetical protein NWR67_13970 [Saprospiraceae bacterium]|jgi:hypothetical protein|nr:hypothetical protein [Saprospiraceae bacterium]MDP4822114.1 hypothetical protein [Saprospiraceae bacterium]MDP4999377.1 hypothetical protein [Saprospiraceae bacterium]